MTLAAFKASLRVGMQVRISDHWNDAQRNTLHTITKLQGNGFFYTRENVPGRKWMEFPRAHQLRFDGWTAHIRLDDERLWTLHLGPHGIVDHYRWERSRGDENECDGERRLAEEAEASGAVMEKWWQEWFERSDEWRDEIGHDIDEQVNEESPSLSTLPVSHPDDRSIRSRASRVAEAYLQDMRSCLRQDESIYQEHGAKAFHTIESTIADLL